MQRSIVSRVISACLSVAGISVFVCLFLSLVNEGSGGSTGNGNVAVVIGDFMLSSFSFAAFLLPLYFFYPAFLLFRRTDGRTAAYDLAVSVIPFFTLALILRLALSPDNSPLTDLVNASFGPAGGIVVLSLLLLLETMFFIRYRPSGKTASGSGGRSRENVPETSGRDGNGTSRASLPPPSYAGSAVQRSISREKKEEYLKPAVSRIDGGGKPAREAENGREQADAALAMHSAVASAVGRPAGNGSVPGTGGKTEAAFPGSMRPDQFTFRVPVIPEPPVLRSVKPTPRLPDPADYLPPAGKPTPGFDVEDTPLSIEDEVIRSEEDLFEEEPDDDATPVESAIADDSAGTAAALTVGDDEDGAFEEDFVPLDDEVDAEEPGDVLPPVHTAGLPSDDEFEDADEEIYDREDDAEELEETAEFDVVISGDETDLESTDPEAEPAAGPAVRPLPGRVLEPGVGPSASGTVRDVTPPGKFSSADSAPPPVHAAVKNRPYSVPIKGLLKEYEDSEYRIIDDATKRAASVLMATLEEFHIKAEVTGIRKGPVITMFEILPAPGVKLSKIVNLADNIALRLAASSVRIVAPIPGKHAVGIEVPNKARHIVSFSEMLGDESFSSAKTEIPIALGKDIAGSVQIMDLVQTPHLLIAGSTGSGKSVCVNSLICSILYRRSPAEVQLMLIDPKIVELKFYNDIPHLLTPVITEPKRAFQALQWCIYEMERRYTLLDALGVRDIRSYNRRIRDRNLATQKLPYIVVVIDEFADLMATTGKELESTLARLAAMSRAVGIHLVLATQRPSIDVITGLIKANIPSRIAFMVASKFDSRIIIDAVGAEKLLGRGDMLFASAWDPFPVRLQGAFLTEEEVERVVAHVKTFGKPDYIDDEIFFDDEEEDEEFQEGEDDPLMEKALEIIMTAGKASASYLQRRLKIGYNRAARLVEILERKGVVGPQNGSKPREILHIPDEYQR